MAIVFLILTIAGAAYLALALSCVVTFGRRPFDSVDDELAPSVTILKPVAGLERDLYENLASFCDQDYPRYEVVFCLHSADDLAGDVIARVMRNFPNCRARVAIGHNETIANPKIANLVKPGVEPFAEIVAVVDSDIRVGRDYVRTIAGSFASERVGAVTCLYRGLPNQTVVSHLGALYVEDGFAPSVLVAATIGKLRFCLGATMAVRRDVLYKIGGFEALGAYLADDHALGELVTKNGFEVELSRYVVRTTIPETQLDRLWSHELRWARTNKAQAPAGYFFSFVMYALPLALIYLALARNLLALAILALVLLLRLALHYAARWAFGIEHVDGIWFVPVRDCLSLGLWAASLFGRTVRWRTETYRA